jgi:hypothetical protein
MDAAQRQWLIRQWAVSKAALTRMQSFIETGDHKLNDIQVRYDELPNIFCKFENAQNELELSDDTDNSADRQQFEDQYFNVNARFHELLHPAAEPLQSSHSSPQGSVSTHSNQTPRSTYTSTCSSTSRRSNQTPRSHTGSSRISLPSIVLPVFAGDTRTWLDFKDTFEALIINNTALSNVQKFHYLTASVQGEARGLLSYLQITNENFSVAWQLLVQRYNNIRLISMMHAKNLCHKPHVIRGNASSLRALINHVSSHINALQALSLNVTMQDLMMNQLIVASLDHQLQQDWEIFTASSSDIPTLADLITFLENRCRASELFQSNQ